jgi:hypothetical protein
MLYFQNFLVSSYVVCTRHWLGARKIMGHSLARYASLLRLKLSHCTRHSYILWNVIKIQSKLSNQVNMVNV